MYLCTVGTRYERSCLIITAIKYSTVLYVLDHVAHHDDQLPLVSVPDATTVTQFGDEAQSTHTQRNNVSPFVTFPIPKFGRTTECTVCFVSLSLSCPAKSQIVALLSLRFSRELPALSRDSTCTLRCIGHKSKECVTLLLLGKLRLPPQHIHLQGGILLFQPLHLR